MAVANPYFDHTDILDEESFTHLLPIFAAEVKSTHEKLKNLPEHDVEQIRALAHKLGGTAASFGATKLKEQARKTSAAVRANDKIQTALSAMLNEMDEALRQVENHSSRHA